MNNENYHIAQINIAKLKYPLTDPKVKVFVDNLDRINVLAESMPGFVWRLQDETGNATNINVFEDELLIVNMSVWKTIEDLFAFTYRTDHIDIFRRRSEWFETMQGPHMALWWTPAGVIPSPYEGKGRLLYLELHGPNPTVFTFKKQYSPEELEEYIQKLHENNNNE